MAVKLTQAISMNHLKSRDYSDLITSMLRSAKYSQVMFVFLPSLYSDCTASAGYSRHIPRTYCHRNHSSTVYALQSRKRQGIFLAISVLSFYSGRKLVKFSYSHTRIRIFNTKNQQPISVIFFAFIAIWINGSQKRTAILFLTFVASFIVTAIVHQHLYGSISSGLNGYRRLWHAQRYLHVGNGADRYNANGAYSPIPERTLRKKSLSPYDTVRYLSGFLPSPLSAKRVKPCWLQHSPPVCWF